MRKFLYKTTQDILGYKGKINIPCDYHAHITSLGFSNPSSIGLTIYPLKEISIMVRSGGETINYQATKENLGHEFGHAIEEGLPGSIPEEEHGPVIAEFVARYDKHLQRIGKEMKQEIKKAVGNEKKKS